jgi:hypothetical protein
VLHRLGGQALALQVSSTPCLQLLDDPVERREVLEQAAAGRVEQQDRRGPLVDVQLRGVAGAESGEDGAEWRCEHPVDTQVVGNAAAVQRPVSAIREHGELFRKVTPNPQFLGHAVGHLLIDLGFDQLGDVDGLQVEVVAELLVDCERRALHIERNPPAGVLLGIEVAE